MALKIGEILLQKGLITAAQLDQALLMQRRTSIRLGVCLVQLGFIDKETLASVLSRQLGVQLAPPGSLDDVPPEVIDRVPRRVAEQHRIIPIRVEGREVHVVLADPQNLMRLDDIAFVLGCRIKPFLATEPVIDRALARYYPVGRDVWEEALSMTGELRDSEMSGAWKLPTLDESALPVVEAVVEEPVMAAAPIKAGDLPPELSVEPTTLPMELGNDEQSYDALSDVKTREDLVAAMFGHFGRIFPRLGVLEITSLGARCLALRASGTAVVLPTERVAIEEAEWIKEQLTRPHVHLYPDVEDNHLRALLRQLGLRWSLVTVIPVFDYGRLRYIVVGQGQEEARLRERYADVRSYLATVSEALRIVALREHIRSRAHQRHAD